MTRGPSTRLCLALALAALLAAHAAGPEQSSADTVVLKNGLVYRGTVDRDNTLLWIYDGLKRVVLRTTRVARIESDAAFRNPETFAIVQPMTVHAGAMPKEVIKVEAGPWDEKGRRSFLFEGARLGKPIRMDQAIIELGPHIVRYRGVNGFWRGQGSTNEVPREVVLGILAKVSREDKDERVRIGRFLIQAEWYAEALQELDAIVGDFPDDADLKERVSAVKESVVELEAEQTFAAADRARRSFQFRAAEKLLGAVPEKGAASGLYEKVSALKRADEAQKNADESTAGDLRALAEQVGHVEGHDWGPAVLEVLKAMTEAPDAVRDRFVAWRKAKLEGPPSTEEQFALAMSGYVAGPEGAVKDLAEAAKLWKFRDLIQRYLGSRDEAARSELFGEMEAVGLEPPDVTATSVKSLKAATRLVRHAPPPLHVAVKTEANHPLAHRVLDDPNDVPTDYLVALPPEYHPLRNYPAVVALHDGTGPKAAIDWWAAEAARRGFIVVAPEYRLNGQGTEYGYTPSEHAAVELALRDARRRYSIDSDRVFLGGQLVGGNMAWDFGLAHPDLFAGVVSLSGLPFKYVGRYRTHVKSTRLPLYVALGDLAPAGNELVFNQVLKPMIEEALDVTYLEYQNRGLEDLPEEAVGAFDWMEQRRREPFPKTFEAVSARESDNRFFGIVIKEHQPGRTTAPVAVDPFGKNLNPATISFRTSAASNLLAVLTNGVKRMDVWVGPDLIDFTRKMELRINGKPMYKGASRPDLQALLEDLRLRGDRQQVYWMKVSAG